MNLVISPLDPLFFNNFSLLLGGGGGGRGVDPSNKMEK